MKLHLPYEFNGKPTTPITNFSIGPMGMDRDIAKKKLFEEDPRLQLDYQSDSEVLRKRAQGVIKSKIDTLYNIEPGETIEAPANHAAYLIQTFPFLKEETSAPEPVVKPPVVEPTVEEPKVEEPATEPAKVEDLIPSNDKK